jgi:hypothetical protein
VSKDILIDKIAVAVAKVLADEVVLDDKQIHVLTAEILAQKYAQRFSSEMQAHNIVHEARKLAAEKLAQDVYEETKLS